jgi:hypothetical protein
VRHGGHEQEEQATHSPKDVFKPGPEPERKIFKPADHVRCDDGRTGIVIEVVGERIAGQ